jgi:glycosyltransferase involved in cell wall biosynthesis
MRTFRPHVVHARSTGVWFDAALASRGYRPGRLLLAFHGRTDLEPVGQRRRVMNRWACRRADAVLSVSTEAARMMWQEWSVPADRLWTIPDGVDTQAYRPPTGDDEKQDARRRLGLADSDVGVMIVSRLVPIKALDVLLRAWRQVSLAHRAARLIVVGDGPLRGDLERQTRELRCHDVVRFLGRRDDVPGLLRGADLFVLASRYEGTNNAVQEAMATGLPIVATDVGGMRDVLTPGETGWLVPPDAPAELAQHILATLADTKARHRVGHAAREAAEREFSLEQWVGRYTGLYRALAGQPSAPAAAMEERACAG